MSDQVPERNPAGRMLRRTVAYAVVLILALTAVPAVAVVPAGGMEVPSPEDWGVPAALQDVQVREMEALDFPAVATAAETAMDGMEVVTGTRDPASGPYTLRTSEPPVPAVPDVIGLVQSIPNGTLPDFLQILIDQPLKVTVYVESEGHVNWVVAYLRPTLVPLNIMGWVAIDIDNDTTTGDATGADLRVRLRPVLEQRNRDVGLVPPRFHVQYRGGLAVEMERLGTGNEDLPVDISFFKWFRYSGVSYTWFLDYEADHLPSSSYMSLTADQVNMTADLSTGTLMEFIERFLSGNATNILNNTGVGSVAGPYTIHHRSNEDLLFVHASLGYMKMASRPGEEVSVLEETSWVTARVLPPTGGGPIAPREFSLWLDSPSFNRTFDQLNWTADATSRLELEYFDARENDTQARAIIDVAATNLRVKIDEGMDDVGRVANIHFTATAPVDLIRFDEWDFVERDRRKYLHTHVELADLPSDVWLNGTLDVGGQEYELLRPDPQARNFLPQMMDAVMVGLASKLFNIGRTLRSLPQNILDMPDKEGFIHVEFADPKAHLGKLEMWLTSDHYIHEREGIDFFAFYNDTLEPEGSMVQTGFSARLLDIRSFDAIFKDQKQIVLDSRYNREFRALFVDVKNDANASIWFSNIPHNISIQLMEDRLVYMGDGTVDRIQYTSEIGEQYIRFRLDGVPGGLNILMGDSMAGLDVLLGEIDSVDLRVTDGPVREMGGDHLMLERDGAGHTAASLHVTGIKGLTMDREERNTIRLSTGGHPIQVLIADEVDNFELKARLDPLPSRMEARTSDLLGASNITFPSLADVTSVLEFGSIMYSISDLAESVLTALDDATVGLVGGLGTFSSNMTFGFDGDRNMDLVASISRTGSTPVEPAPWVHGVSSNMLPEGDGVLIDAKVFLTGISPKGSIQLASSAGDTRLDMELDRFAPRFDHFALMVRGASLIEDGGGKDIWLYMDDVSSPLDLDIDLDIDADVSIGGTTRARLGLSSSLALGALHLSTRIRGDSVATVEAMLSNIPTEANLDLVYSDSISLRTDLSQRITFAMVKLCRNMAVESAPATTVVLHDVPTLAELNVFPGADFDMDAPSPLDTLPTLNVDTNEAGMDVLVDIEGRSLGNKANVHLDARDVDGLSTTLSGKEYRISAERLDYIHIGVSHLVYSESLLLDRLDVAATKVRSASLRLHMVFGVYPLIDVDDIVSSGLQLALVGRINLMNEWRDIKMGIFEVPLSMASLPRSHSNGVALGDTRGQHRLFVPAPISTLLGTLMG